MVSLVIITYPFINYNDYFSKGISCRKTAAKQTGKRSWIWRAVGGGVPDAPNVPFFDICGASPKGLASLRRTPPPTALSYYLLPGAYCLVSSNPN